MPAPEIRALRAMRGQKRMSPRITPITRMKSSDILPCDSCDPWFLCPFCRLSSCPAPAICAIRENPWLFF
jgi:hypothetical protein